MIDGDLLQPPQRMNIICSKNQVVADLGTGDYNMKLRVYKGTQLVTENTLIDLPTGVVTFHMDTTHPPIPAIAVASAAHIYIYKNLRPYFKFTLPTLEILAAEKAELQERSFEDFEGGLCKGFIMEGEVG